MQRDPQIIGDRIEFMGYHIADVRDVPASIRARFEERFASAISYGGAFRIEPKPRKAKK